MPLSEFPLLDESQYQPCGGTALNDAVAGLIKSIGAPAQGRRNSVLCVIVTDGMENVSRCYRIEDVRQMVTYRQLTHGWQFLFLGPESALDYALSIGTTSIGIAWELIGGGKNSESKTPFAQLTRRPILHLENLSIASCDTLRLCKSNL